MKNANWIATTVDVSMSPDVGVCGTAPSIVKPKNDRATDAIMMMISRYGERMYLDFCRAFIFISSSPRYRVPA